ncbi:MAG: beta-ketoacyl synthase [Phycisphaerae bacterium]
MTKKTAITGLGMVSPLGFTAEDNWQALLEGKCALGPIKSIDASAMPCQIAGECEDYKMRDYLPKYHRKAAKLMSRDIELSVMAADDAFRSSGLGTKHIEAEPAIVPERTAINIGATLINCEIPEIAPSVMKSLTDGKFDMKKWGVDGLANLTPLWLLKYLPNMLACHIGIIHDIQGPGNNITTAECSGAQALFETAGIIADGLADVGICGSGEATTHPITLMRAAKQGRLNTQNNESPADAVRPFSADACGTVLSEGAAMCIIELHEAAEARGAKVYATIEGCGESVSHSDDYTLLEESGEGLAIAIENALEEAGISADMIELILPVGSGIAANDAAELNAYKTVFGTALAGITILPTKRLLGLMGSASAAADIVIAAKALSEQKIPGVGVYGKLPAEINVNKTTTEKRIRYALCCGFARGGQTCAVVLKKGGE